MRNKRKAPSMRRLLRQAIKKNGMPNMLNHLFGIGNWTYDDSEKLWLARDPRHIGPGQGYYCIKANGDWFKANIPNGVMQ